MRATILVCVLIAACSPADDTGRTSNPDTMRAGAGGVSTAGTVAGQAGRGSLAGGAGSAPIVVAGSPAIPPAAGSPPAAGGGAPPVAGRSSAPAGSPAVPPAPQAGSTAPPPPRTPAARSAGCGKPNTMVGAFQAQIRAFELDRGYYLSVPKDYNPERAYRLVFGYHGSNYTGMRMRQYLDNEKAPLLDGTIFVYPDGLPLTNQPSNVAWELTANGRDIAFFDALYDFLRTTYCIDETRVFVNGQSYGGLMTNFVGCVRGDVIRAIAVVAGSGPRGACQGKVAVWLTHGMDDMNVPFASGEASRDTWVKANGCSTMTVPGEPMQCLNYQGCDPEHPVIWCPHVMDGGHQHPSFGRKAVRDFLAKF